MLDFVELETAGLFMSAELEAGYKSALGEDVGVL